MGNSAYPSKNIFNLIPLSQPSKSLPALLPPPVTDPSSTSIPTTVSIPTSYGTSYTNAPTGVFNVNAIQYSSDANFKQLQERLAAEDARLADPTAGIGKNDIKKPTESKFKLILIVCLGLVSGVGVLGLPMWMILGMATQPNQGWKE